MGDQTAHLLPTQVAPGTQWSKVSTDYLTSYGTFQPNSHCAAVRADGTFHTWGDNFVGQLGLGSTGGNQTSPQQVGTDSNWIDAACGQGVTVGVKADGSLWSWGHNLLGIPGVPQSTSPSQVAGVLGVSAVTCGPGRVFVLGPFGTVWAWGGSGLGFPYPTSSPVPVQVPGLFGVIEVACGTSHTLVRKSDGTVWAWGSNDYGQLGDGMIISRQSPVQVAGLPSSVVSLAATVATSYAVTADGGLWTWGQNSNGELGIGTAAITYSLTPIRLSTLPNMTAVGGSDHALAIKSDGTAWTWGTSLIGSSNSLAPQAWSPQLVTGLMPSTFGAYINAAALIPAGSVLDLTVFSSAPIAPIFVLADTQTASIPLVGPGNVLLGTSHLAFSPSFVAITDPSGALGGGFTYPYTNIFGAWNLQIPLPPTVSGVTFFTEAYVVSPAAPNGVLYQSNLISLTIL